ncbi:MAG: putative DNA binding domain-containing protein [Polyangiaceae bacterium]|nr:putative DNA binding domain-containing protein [Polyangiaceae bacterium]
MDERTLKERLRLGEDSTTELKSVAHDGFEFTSKLQQTIAKEIAAFANSGGGLLIVGAEDDGTPTGTGTAKQTDKLVQQLSAICQTQVHPALFCTITKVLIDDKVLLLMEVPAWSPNRPYSAGSKFYLRDGSSAREASRDELVRMLQSQAVHLDEQPARGAVRADLDEGEIGRFLHRVYPHSTRDPTAYLRALKCLENDQPTVTGILFFGMDPQRFFPDARITAVRFPGPGISATMQDKKEIAGTVFRQIEAAQRFLQDHVPIRSAIVGFERKDRGIPEIVLREALHNALAHRDYNAASQVRIFVYSDRVEIINPGLLLNRLTIDSIKLGGITQRRNPAMSALIARNAGSENVGLGMPLMFEQMKAARLPEPEIDLSGGHFRLVLRWEAPEAAA